MWHPLERTRVHVAGVGWKEWERVVFPLEQLRAERLYLFDHAGPTAGDKRSQDQVELIRKWAGENNVECEDVHVDLWDAASVANRIKRLIDEHPAAEFRFNASTGPKPCVIGGIMASMFWQIQPYYVFVRYWDERKVGTSQYPPDRVEFLPTFRVGAPRAEAIQALGVLIDAGGSMAQANFLAKLRETNVIRPKQTESKLRPQAAYSQLQSIITNLDDLRFVERASGDRKNEIRVTTEGRAGFRMFGAGGKL